MLARWLRILTLMELIGAGALAWLLADRGAGVPASLAIGLAAPFLVHGHHRIDFGLAAWAGSPTPPPCGWARAARSLCSCANGATR
jgi:hypothetical protein